MEYEGLLDARFRFRNIAWLPNKIFMPICISPSYIWKYLFAPLKRWLFEGRASSVFFAISGPVPCRLPAEVSHRLTVGFLCTSPLHRCCSLLTPKLQSHCFFLWVSQTHLLLLTSYFLFMCGFGLESTSLSSLPCEFLLIL